MKEQEKKKVTWSKDKTKLKRQIQHINDYYDKKFMEGCVCFETFEEPKEK